MAYQFISADNHLDTRWLPKGIWRDRVPARYKASAPRVVETRQGSVWEWEGKRRGDSADGSSNSMMLERYFAGTDVPAGALPPADANLILRHMDMANTYAGVFYGDTRKWAVKDSGLLKAIYRAYNDFALELNSTASDRIIVLPNLPTAFPKACIAELIRLIKKGTKAVEFGVFDVGLPIYDAVWEPVWAAAEEAGVPICCHIGDKAGTPYPPNVRGSSLAHFATVPFCAARPIAQFVFSGVLERYPKLQISFAECRIGWLPFLISWMDRQVREREPDPTVPLKLLPSEYVRRNMTFTFEEDYVGARLVPHEWAHIRDSVMWGSDYPHEQGTWPDAQEVIERMFAGVDPKLKREIVFDRAARVFGIEGGRA